MSALGAKLKSIFTEFASNKEHVIPREKLVNILQQLDPTWTQDELDTLFEIADKDQNFQNFKQNFSKFSKFSKK